jgi:hypothetical protein
MNIAAGVFLGNRNQVVMIKNDSLWLLEIGAHPKVLVENYKDIRYLTACSNGIYLAFWANPYNGFHIYDICGNYIWDSYINGDKALPQGIHSSTAGFSFLFDFEGCPGSFYCDIDQGFSTIFSCSGSPAGFDNDMQYFLLNGFDSLEMKLYEIQEGTGARVQLNSEVVKNRLKQGPLLVDRSLCVLPFPKLSVNEWDGLVMQTGNGGVERLVVLNGGEVKWISMSENEPVTTIKNCLTEKEGREFFRCTFEACGDNALIQSKNQAIVVNRNLGLVWRGNSISSASLKDRRILVQYQNNTVEVIREDGTLETRELPPYGYWTIAADIINNELKIASYNDEKYRFAIRTVNLTTQ